MICNTTIVHHHHANDTVCWLSLQRYSNFNSFDMTSWGQRLWRVPWHQGHASAGKFGIQAKTLQPCARNDELYVWTPRKDKLFVLHSHLTHLLVTIQQKPVPALCSQIEEWHLHRKNFSMLMQWCCKGQLLLLLVACLPALPNELSHIPRSSQLRCWRHKADYSSGYLNFHQQFLSTRSLLFSPVEQWQAHLMLLL